MSQVDFEVVSYNVNGIGDDRKRRKIFNFVKKHTSSKALVCLQETHSTLKNEKLFEYQWRGKILFSHGTSGSKGVCICFRYDLEYKLLNVISDKGGRYIICHMEIQGEPYVIINCYAPNEEKGQVKVFKDILGHVGNLDLPPDCKFICAGDWNLIFDTKLDSFGEKSRLKRKSIYQLKSIMSSFELIDIWRVRNPTLRQFTWRRKNPRQMSRIDFFLVSEDLQSEVKSCEFLCPLSSDHSPVKLKIQANSTGMRGRGYWKFNNSLLENRQFVSEMKNTINEVVSTFGEFDDPRINWEYLKFKMREFSRDRAIELTKARKKERENLEFKVKSYDTIAHPTEEELRGLENAKAELEKIYEHITNGIILRSKVQWYEEGEKASKYFLLWEKNRKAKSCIRKLNSDEHGEITNPQIILSELKQFYTTLYKKRSIKTEKECLEFLASLNAPRLSSEEKSLCEGKLSLQEC